MKKQIITLAAVVVAVLFANGSHCAPVGKALAKADKSAATSAGKVKVGGISIAPFDGCEFVKQELMGKTYTDFSQLSKGMFRKSDPVVEVKPLPPKKTAGDDALAYFGIGGTGNGESGGSGRFWGSQGRGGQWAHPVARSERSGSARQIRGTGNGQRGTAC